MNSSLPWPTEAPVIPLREARPILDRIASLARTHEQDVTLVPGAALAEEDTAADPPPALEQILDELGGIELCGIPVLMLLIEDRTDVGPYTLLGKATTFYPLYETPEVAVVLTLDDDGAPGVVYGIGEDLALQLAAPDLLSYLERFADALEASLQALAQRGDEPDTKGDARAEAAQELMDQHLFAAIVGAGRTRTSTRGLPGRTRPSSLQDASASGIDALPDGALLVADLRAAPVGARVDLIDADVPGDPLDLRIAWRDRGRLVTLHTD